MAQPESQMSLFEGVALISQWSTMEHGKLQTCLEDLGTSIENITKRVISKWQKFCVLVLPSQRKRQNLSWI